MRRWLFVILGVTGSIVILWLVLRGVDFNEVIKGIAQANPFWLLLNFIGMTGALWTRAIRWRGILGFSIPLRDAFFLQGVTFMLNQLPLRAGEVARSAFATQHNVSFFTAATSIVVERLLDVLLVVIVLAFSLAGLPDVPPEVARGALTFGALGVVAFGVLVFFAKYPKLAYSLLDTLTRLLPFLGKLPLRRLLESVLAGLERLTHWRGFVHAVVWTLLAWGVSYFTLYVLVFALDIRGVDAWLMAFIGISLVALGLALPLSVASLGPFQAGVVLAGTILGMDYVEAVTLGFLLNGMSVLSYLFWGAVGLWALGLNVRGLLSSAPPPEAPPATTTEA